MEQDQNNSIKTESGPNAPTQVDKVSTTEVKPDTNNTTELNKPAAVEAKECVPETSGNQENEGKYIYTFLIEQCNLRNYWYE